ncbi:hypothetical protein BvCmsH78B_04943 [Escherichia coli]|uniref:Uncharacterized protein n=1 Tax=Escherichia coli TaxID=562 RepID=A0A479E0I6_ECOLX|nr:Uncharacterised protein [Escherichia coli]SQO51767.1 Uncharacterised protein [Escherichia coli]SQO76597.1 Uncharacterised protein [Escherichia coli]SQY42033.1 Uncharacterised protein [Escherichia coli]SQY48066.1 Uncharacterised protein [Escherichia coli]
MSTSMNIKITVTSHIIIECPVILAGYLQHPIINNY